MELTCTVAEVFSLPLLLPLCRRRFLFFVSLLQDIRNRARELHAIVFGGRLSHLLSSVRLCVL